MATVWRAVVSPTPSSEALSPQAATAGVDPPFVVRLAEPIVHPLLVDDLLRADEHDDILRLTELRVPGPELLGLEDASHAPIGPLYGRALLQNWNLERAGNAAAAGYRANQRDNFLRLLEAIFVNGRLGRRYCADDERPHHSLSSLVGDPLVLGAVSRVLAGGSGLMFRDPGERLRATLGALGVSLEPEEAPRAGDDTALADLDLRLRAERDMAKLGITTLGELRSRWDEVREARSISRITRKRLEALL